MLSEEHLRDPSRFLTISGVPILDAHHSEETSDDKGDITEELLNLIAHNTNRRISRGTFPQIQIGHTTDTGKESAQPEPIGFTSRYVVGDYKGTPCLYCDFHIDRRKKEDALKYPHRSVERLKSDQKAHFNLIDSVSLLRRAPERDIGIMYYSRNDHRIDQPPPDAVLLRYARNFPPLGGKPGGASATPDEEESMPLAPEDMKALIEGVASGVAKALFAKLEKYDSGEEGGMGPAGGPVLGDEEEPEEGPPPEEEGMPEDEEEGPEPYEGEETPEEEEAETQAGPPPEKPAKYEASAPSGTNTFVPGGRRSRYDMEDDTDDQPSHRRNDFEGRDDDEDMGDQDLDPEGAPEDEDQSFGGPGDGDDEGAEDEDDEQEVRRVRNAQAGIQKSRYQRDLARMQAENDKQKKRIAQLERYNREATIERDLTNLLAQGYQFDLEEEVNDCVDMSHKQYGKHYNRIKRRYHRDPIDQDLVRSPEAVTEGDIADTLTAEDSEAIVRYSRANKIDNHTEAVRAYLAAKLDARRMGQRA
jgi:hypothetical protein